MNQKDDAEQVVFTFLTEVLKGQCDDKGLQIPSFLCDIERTWDNYNKEPNLRIALHPTAIEALSVDVRTKLTRNGFHNNPYCHFYMSMFAFTPIHEIEDQKIEPLYNDIGDITDGLFPKDGEIDCERFSHFGRILGPIVFLTNIGREDQGSWGYKTATDMLIRTIGSGIPYLSILEKAIELGEENIRVIEDMQSSYDVLNRMMTLGLACASYHNNKDLDSTDFNAEIDKSLVFLETCSKKDLDAKILKDIKGYLNGLIIKEETLDDVMDSFKVQVQDIIENMKKEDLEGFVEAEKKAKESLKINKDKK